MQGTLAGALPIIVTNYAHSFGVRVRMQGIQAYTDGNVITIPRLDLKDPIKARLAYGYLAHEAAHVRYTDFAVVKRCSSHFLRSCLLNILEDARVEMLIGKTFIGVWENLELLRSYDPKDWHQYKKELSSLPVLQVILGFLLCYTGCYGQRFKILRKKAAFLCHTLRQRMSKHALRRIARVSLKVLACKNTHDVEIVTEELIFELNKSGCFDPNDKFFHKNHSRTFVLEQECRNGELGIKRQRFKAELNSQFKALKESTAKDFRNLAPRCDPALVVDGAREDADSARDDLGVFEVGICKAGRSNFISKIEQSHALRNRLCTRIKAYVENLGGSRLQGRRINPYKAAYIRTGENKIFYDRIEEQGLSTSVHMLVDVSGSMISSDGESISRCEAACRCALSLAVALDGIEGVTPLCSFFPGNKSEIEVALKENQRVRERAAFFDQKPRGSTPLAQALWHAASTAKALSSRRHIVLVLTDGIPDSIKQAKIAIEHLKDLHVECYGIGIRLDFIRSLLPHSCIINSPSELDKAMFSLLEKIMVPAEGASLHNLFEDPCAKDIEPNKAEN